MSFDIRRVDYFHVTVEDRQGRRTNYSLCSQTWESTSSPSPAFPWALDTRSSPSFQRIL